MKNIRTGILAVKEEILVYADANGEFIADLSASVNQAKIRAIRTLSLN